MKQCTKCLTNKSSDTDNFYKRKNGSLESTCKECSKKRTAKVYLSNRVHHMAVSTASRNIRQNISREYIFQYLKDHPCVDCGQSNVLTLEFDHTDPIDKKNTISKMMCQGDKLDNIKKEMSKCEVRCANCHKIKTAKQQQWYKFLFLEREKEDE